ncbi:sugar-binding domain-containing protein [Saccharicrinis aurantiacus]|uniref:sugar-binding domain-containing protein n=1 Tax=Saccharicrinis aurantiacus TaxID=1849719 RepID=UPI00248F4F90|nr:sugar-binding domain-containing protein [Saccharicrinis aurantiacus]
MNSIIKSLTVFICCITLFSCTSDQQTKNGKHLFDFDWKFVKGDIKNAQQAIFDDSQWDNVNLPHDWSIEGPFSKENASFSRGAWLPAGKCMYRKSFEVSAKDQGKRFVIYFDGAYRNSEVYINGHLLGKRPLGYIAFHYDLTDHLNYGGENTIAVKLDNSAQPGSRWYTGTGIYRHVHLIVSDKLYVPVWGNYIHSNDYNVSEANLNIETSVKNDFDKKYVFTIRHTVIDANGKQVTQYEEAAQLASKEENTFKSIVKLESPRAWSQNNPHLYTIKTELLSGSQVMYSEENKTGIRKFEYSSDKGFFINGVHTKLKGVCLHHAGGPLGAAIHRRTIERQLEVLNEMGCNAVRTAHNPFSEEFLEVCDSMGFIVMNEVFDEWEKIKSPTTVQDGKKIRIPVDFYANEFKQWADTDLTDCLLRDRNHISIAMWSIGNEIVQMMNPEGAPIGERLANIVHQLDYRPVTNGVYGYGWNKWPNSDAVATSDIYGYNYIKDDGLTKERKAQPNTMAVITEHESAQSFYPRGTYLYGKEKQEWWDKLNYKHDDAYEWVEKRDIRGEVGMEAWRIVKTRPHMMGMFIWTGWDYLGEVIPFGWPARSSSFAPIDLCGFPKDGYFFYQSQWTEEPMVHIYPHWNLDGMEGEKVTVYAYTNGQEVELFQDGKSLGKQKNETEGVEYQEWEVIYKPGVLKAVAYNNNQAVASKTVATAGKANTIEVKTRKNEMKANGQDLIYVECTLTDKDGNVAPKANNMLNFSVEGPASIAGVGNGDNMCHEAFKANKHSAFNGKCLVILQSTKEAGTIKLNIQSDGMVGKSIELTSK